MGIALHHESARRLVEDLLRAYGATPANAAVVADHLVASDLAGVSSHGLIRVPQYVDEILAGEINPEATPAIARQAPAHLRLDGHRCFGQVAGLAAVKEVGNIARVEGIALATLRDIGHAGRIGAYAEQCGHDGLVSVLFCSGPRSGHRVSPFNGRQGRLATNPIAFSVPTSGDPIVGDFSTAAAPEGHIRHLRILKKPAPEETLLDGGGHESTDPNVLYEEPPGTIMPLGGRRLGHRGFALGLLVEALATLLAGDMSTDVSRIGNNLAILAVQPDDAFTVRADDLAAYVLDTEPRADQPVVLPGALEQERRRSSSTIVVEDAVWIAIVERAQARHVLLPAERIMSG